MHSYLLFKLTIHFSYSTFMLPTDNVTHTYQPSMCCLCLQIST